VTAVLASGEEIKMTGPGLSFARELAVAEGRAEPRMRRGAVIRVSQDGGSSWSITQMPEVESAFVAADPTTARSARWSAASISTATSSTT
jgi:penicillin-binding protein 1A